MKLLILSMTVGEGHNSIAKSVAGEIEKLGVETKIVQVFGFDQARVEKENKKYLWACKHIPHLYDFVWNCIRNKNPNRKAKMFKRSLKQCSEYISEEIEKEKPDGILCTHYYASTVLSLLKEEKRLKDNIVTATVLFDFCVHPYWEFSSGVDYIIAPTEEVTPVLLNKNYKQEQIKVLGFPIRDEFAIKRDKDKTREQLGIDKKFTVFTIAGGNGLGNSLKLIKEILKENKDVNVVCVNGKNKKSYELVDRYIKENNLTNIINLGFISNVAQYMAASDVIVSRGGGGSLSEATAIGRPIIIREKMINNESINKELLINKGIALGMNKISDIGILVKKIKDDQVLYRNMQNACESFAKPNAVKDVSRFLYDQMQQRNKGGRYENK